MKKSRNLLEIHISVLLFGLAGLFGKFITLSPIIIVFGRVFFASIALILILGFFKQGIKLKSMSDYFWLILLGVILAIHWVTFFHSIQISTVAIGLLSFSTFPVFTTFIEPYVFKERIKLSNIIIALVTLLGVGIIIPSFELNNNITQGVIWGTVSGFTFALLSILNKKYVKKYSSLVISFYQDGVAMLVLLPFILFDLSSQPELSLHNILLLILLGVVFTAIAHTLFIKGLTNIKAQLASIIASLEPVYGIIFAALFLNEIPTLKTILGGVIILGATFYATLTAKS